MSDVSTHPPTTIPPDAGPAPADAIVRPAWPMWRRVLAYAILFACACAAVLVVDRKVHIPQEQSVKR